jgi:hypothetical protein
MTPEDSKRAAALLKAVPPFDAETATRKAQFFLAGAKDGDWADSIPIHLWEGLRRQGQGAATVDGYVRVLREFMTDEPAESGERPAKRGWKDLGRIDRLLEAMKGASLLPLSAERGIRELLPDDLADETIQATRLRQAREFLLMLVTILKTERANS